MGMEVETDYKALEDAVRAVFEAGQDCEHPAHKDSEKHAGDAGWYVHIKHDCGLDLVEPVCAVWKGWLESDIMVMCRGCYEPVRAKQFVVGSVAIG